MTGDLSQAARSDVWERRELAAFIHERRGIVRAALVAGKPRISHEVVKMRRNQSSVCLTVTHSHTTVHILFKQMFSFFAASYLLVALI